MKFDHVFVSQRNMIFLFLNRIHQTSMDLERKPDFCKIRWVPNQFTRGYRTEKVGRYFIVANSVSDPSHFDVDPDPGIHIWEKWIRIL